VKFQIPFRNQILRPNAAAQQEMFVGGLAEILLKASEGDQVTISLKFYAQVLGEKISKVQKKD